MQSEAPKTRATLLYARDLSIQDQRVARVLDLFGAAWAPVPMAEFTGAASFRDIERDEMCILSSAACLSAALGDQADLDDAVAAWAGRARSVYVYGFDNTEACRRLLRWLTADEHASVRSCSTSSAELSVTGHFVEMCGPMSGLEVTVKTDVDDAVFDVQSIAEGFQSIITSDGRTVFFKVMHGGVCFYLSACREIIDIASRSRRSFNVKEHFCKAVPLVMFVRWAFRDVRPAETNGCLIVDDPPLKRRYGFLRFRKALALMDRYGFATTLAFIPWNWRRTQPATVNLFKERPDRLSLSVHGCDHTAGEFGERSTAVLSRRVKTALHRMDCLRSQTSLPYDPVMIFPQGVFSAETGRTLKVNGFWAAANTEVSPPEESENQTTIADLWDVAIMKYGTLPIFTRRYLTDGVENFAFDGLLGKPCLIVAHHDAFRGTSLVEFIAALNALSWTLRWRSLGDVVRRSARVEGRLNGPDVVRLYSTAAKLTNDSTESREVVLVKQESDPTCVKAVMVNSRAVDWSYQDRQLYCRAMLAARSTTDVRIEYVDTLNLSSTDDGTAFRIKLLFRRYLSEFRDNYVSMITSARN